MILEERGGELSTFDVTDVLSCDEYRDLWIKWDVSGGNTLLIGRGSTVNEKEIGRHDIEQPHEVIALTFANDGQQQQIKWDISAHSGILLQTAAAAINSSHLKNQYLNCVSSDRVA